MSNTTEPTLPFTFGEFTVPAGCRRILITAELEPSNEGSLIQPTGFPDLGPILYPDPSGKNGLICLIESEASMANRLEEVCFDPANKAIGTLRSELTNLPHIKLTKEGTAEGEFVTSSTVDGHRFASEYIMGAEGRKVGEAFESIPANENKSGAKKAAKADGQMEFVTFVQQYLGMTGPDKCPAANVSKIFKLAMSYDPLALVHGFQISVKKLKFVGLRSPRALNASILGMKCQRVTVPGIRFDSVGGGDAGQAIFQKPRITAERVVARFSIDVGLITSLGLTDDQTKLIIKLCLCKVAWFLSTANSSIKLRTECDLRLKQGTAKAYINRSDSDALDFGFEAIATAASSSLAIPASPGCSPLVLKHVAKKKDDKASDATSADSDDSGEEQTNDE